MFSIVDSNDRPKYSKDASVVHNTTNILLDCAQKTIESACSNIGIPSYTRRTISEFSLMEKVLDIDNPSTYA
jgi:hypothetical protein